MRYSLLVTLFSTIVNWVVAQSTERIYSGFKRDTTNLECLELIQQADSVFAINKDTIKLQRPFTFSNTQQKVLKDSYNINAVYPRIFIDDCFNYRLKQLESNRFNADVMSITEKIADSLDKAGSGNLYENPLLSPAKDWLSTYIKKSLSLKRLGKLKSQLGTELVYVGIAIDSSGICHLIGVTIKSKQLASSILSKIINGKKLFYPRTIEGHKVNTEEWVALRLQ